MSKSEAQIKNEKEVRRIMEERSYEFWGEPSKPKNKKKTKTKPITKITIAALSITLVGVGGTVILEKIDENKKIQFDECMTQSSDKYYEESEKNGHYKGKIEKDNAQIQCYNEYGGDDKEEKIAELERDKKDMAEMQTGTDLATCINEAEENYAVPDEERANAGNDVNALLILIKRMGSGIDAKMDCHNKYRTSDYETQMSKLRADKSENEAYIADAESTIRYGQTRPQVIYQQPTTSSSVHCSSRSIGSSIYTDCY